MFNPNGPFTLTFGMALGDVRPPTLIIRRKGGVKELRPYHDEQHVKVLILGGNDLGAPHTHSAARWSSCAA